MARKGLFRDEAVQAQRKQWLGAIHLATPLSFLWLALLAAALAAAIVLFMIFGQYTRRARVSGQLVPTTGVLGVRSASDGTVMRVYVHEGQTVHAGEPLVEISDVRNSAALGSTPALVAAQLDARRKRLRTQLTDQQQSAQQQKAGLQAQLKLLKQQTTQLNGQISLAQRQVANSRDMLAKLLPLRKKGYVSAYQVAQQRATMLQQQSQIKTLLRQRLDASQQIAKVQQQLDQLPLTLATKQRTVRQSLSQIHVQRAQNALKQATVLRAPAAGVVSTLLVNPGEAVAAGQSLLSVLPQGSVLQARLLVPSSAIGFIQTGNEVVMRYQAYPYQKFGQQYGKVISVSRSALSDRALATLLGTRSQEPLYRVLVALKRQTIFAYGKPQALKPGMTLNADIMLDRRSLWQWAFEPLIGLRQSLATGGS